eukprot:sb/3469326/
MPIYGVVCHVICPYMVLFGTKTGRSDYVVDIQLGYDVSKLFELQREREEAAKLQTRYKDLHVEEPEGDLTYHTGTCGCCGGNEVDGLTHFNERVSELDVAWSLEQQLVKNRRLNFVFVVWKTPGQCKEFINDHMLANFYTVCKKEEPFESHRWQVRQAPVYYDINCVMPIYGVVCVSRDMPMYGVVYQVICLYMNILHCTILTDDLSFHNAPLSAVSGGLRHLNHRLKWSVKT